MKLILNDKYYIENLNEGITLQESLDGIAYTATIELLETDELKAIGIKKGDKIKVEDMQADYQFPTYTFDGLVWEVVESKKDKKLTITGKERTIYMEQSEEDYLLPEGQTATQRLTKYAKDWNIPAAWLVDTQIKLSKAKYSSETLLSMMQKDLKETAQKGGDLYKIRMLDKLNIIKLGSNKNVWKLETIIEEEESTSSLDGAVTKVKVLGQDSEDDKATPVIGTYSKDTDKYGTLQKIVQDEKVTTADQAKKKSDSIFNSGKETKQLHCNKDINTIRSGDSISLDGVIWYVIDITHNMNIPYSMDINVGTLDYIRSSMYNDDTQ